MSRTDFSQGEETEITGELVRHMKDVVEDDESPVWMHSMEVRDDPPQNAPGRLGRSRRRVDIEFVLVQRGRRPNFHFEAKRLYRSDSVSEYLGKDGLLLFVTGAYAPYENDAGMLGYVQTETPRAWLLRLSEGFKGRRTELRLCAGTKLEPTALTDESKSIHVSCHERGSRGSPPIRVYHTLLDFT